MPFLVGTVSSEQLRNTRMFIVSISGDFDPKCGRASCEKIISLSGEVLECWLLGATPMLVAIE